MNSPESPPWGFLQWAVAGLASIGASAAAFVWRLMTRIHTLEIVLGQHQRDLDISQSANESALLRLAERLALLHDDHYRLRETIGGLPSRADIHDLELRLGERLDSLAVRFDRAFNPHLSWSPLQNALTRDSVGFSENVSRRCRAVTSANHRWPTPSSRPILVWAGSWKISPRHSSGRRSTS